MSQQKRTTLIFISILLHVFLVLLWEGAVRLGIINMSLIPPAAEKKPIVFELEQPQEPRQVVETPDDAETLPPERADLLSDKNASARNPESKPELPEGDAYSEGIIDSHELPTPRLPAGDTLKKQEMDPEEKQDTETTDREIQDQKPLNMENIDQFYQKYLEREAQEKKTGARDSTLSARHNQQLLQSMDMGGMSFNTYDWDFAPYMIQLKQRIQRNIFPPHAFTYLGLISGETLLRFRIYPDGRLEGPEILGYRGHKTLMETSKSAVEVSAPFPALPKDFPEEYLEITGRFNYIIRK